MEIREFNFNQKRRIDIAFLGDIHEGAANFQEEKLKKAVSKIKKSEAKVVLMGDLIDCISFSDTKRFNPVEIARKYEIRDLKDLPRKQMNHVYQYLKPIENQIIAVIVGNHEEQYIKRHHFDIYDYFVSDILKGKPQKLGSVGMMVIKLLSRRIDIAVAHGVGGGGYREGYPLNNITDCFRDIEADAYITGHVHKMFSQSFGYYAPKTIQGEWHMEKKYKVYGTTGCFLEKYVQGQRNYFEGKKGGASDIGYLNLNIWKRDEDEQEKIHLNLEKILL